VRRAATWAALAAGCMLFAALPARCAPAEGARARFDRALKATRDARADFTQTSAGPLGPVTSRGTFEYTRPRRVRMTWRGAAAATAYVVADTFWFDQPGQGAIVRGDARAVGVPAGLFVDASLAELERTCRVVATGPLALELTPRAAGAAWTRLVLAIDPATGWPRTLTLTTADGTTSRLAFGAFRLNRGIAPRSLLPRVAAGRVVMPWMGAAGAGSASAGH